MSPGSLRRGCSRLEQFPIELIFEILSHLRVPSIKQIGLASSNLRRICIPFIFQDVSFHADKAPHDFQTAMRRLRPVPCIRKLSFHDVDPNIKPHLLLEWCAAAQDLEIWSVSKPRPYVRLLSGLRELRIVKLDRIIFQSLADFFELFRSLSGTVKDVRIGDVEFLSTTDSNPIPCTRKWVKVERLRLTSALVLELLLRNDSPVEFLHLQVAETRGASSHIIKKIGHLSPRLVKLIMEDPPLESNNEPLELPTVKQLNISFRSLHPGLTSLNALLNVSDTELEELTIKLPFEFIINERGEWEWLALALSRRPKLKRVTIVAWTKWSRTYSHVQVMLHEFRRQLEPWRRMVLQILANDRFDVIVDVAYRFGGY
ncbi:uncharacterized protein BT62DRAFT_1008789 [Guyanagaster necrorhizus]|uniref:F-box domain-containing protein n=1 Tax=Guyanagaster necrorhizus TaxID=856835 RepID=A0A9P7VNS7_9AGAR|nr:uncharacterized protein BT62DRAFT_1008789 [Guyanagaster necrorhizus MCA 3950]KAG7443730.1 hypothetical protein BT62DRAFT_1008789 [Guyanagaster necrorhizus MCA 3950]